MVELSVVSAVVSVLSLVHVLLVVAVPPVHVYPSSLVHVDEQPSPFEINILR